MRRILLFVITIISGLACSAQVSQQDHSLTAHPSPLTSQRYDAFFLEAICQRQKGNSDAAFDLLRHCTEIDSARSEAWYFLAQYYSALKQKDKALAMTRKAVDLEPANTTYVETLAGTYLNQHKYAEAIPVLERLYEQRHERTDLLEMLMQLYESIDDHDNAIRTLSRLEVAEGKSERLSYAKSELYSKKGDKKSAIREMKALADQYPNDLNYRCLYANTLYNNGQQKKALKLYANILKAEPDNRNALLAMLKHYHEAGDSLKESATLEHILLGKNANTQDRVTLMRQLIADSEQRGGDSTRVLQLFRQMLAQPQSDADMAMFCAAYMNLKKMPSDSISPILEQALAVAPDNVAARMQLVGYAWEKQDRDHIISLCSEARQYTPTEMVFYYYQGIAYYQNQQLDEALNAFQNGISVINDQSSPEMVSDFYAVMGDIMHQKGMEREAFAAYDSCLQWKDDNIGCLNNYAYYLSVLGQQLEKAEQMSYRTIKAESKNPTYLDTYAWILFMQERYSEAKIYIDQTLQYDTDTSAVILEHAGDIYYHTGDTDQAVALWEKALAKAADDSEIKGERRELLMRKIKQRKYLRK